jgi:hypothetical protein
MAVINSANTSAAVEREVILSIVQDELLKAAKLRPTVSDYSGSVGQGDKSVEIPKFTASFTGPDDINTDGTTAAAFQNYTLGTDAILLNKHKVLPYRITDRAKIQSAVNLEAEAAKSAGQNMGIYIDDQIIARLREASAAAPDHVIDLETGADISGTGTKLTLQTVAIARKKLKEQNVPEDGSWWLVIPPEQEKEMILIDNFRNADKYGSREALLEGEIGRVYGFRVMVHNGLASNECFAYTPKAVGFAMQQEVKFEKQRADVRLQADDYSFTLLMGDVNLSDGKLNIHMLGA